ncbi:MAG: TadE/TadG family type IV pilus assembly protein [Verrucomicrobiia bacterium]|jgi:Flp pilus assembly protein TadG
MRYLLQGIRGRLQRRGRDRSGQALVEFVVPAVFLILLLFGLIDFAIAIYYRQVMINVSREGSNIAARGAGSTQEEAISNALDAVVSSAHPLLIMGTAADKGMGRVIISAVISSNNATYRVTAQVAKGGLSSTDAPSKVGPNGLGRIYPSNLPNTSPRIPAGHSTLYVTEVYYRFKPASPLGRLVSYVMTNQLYDVAYF